MSETQAVIFDDKLFTSQKALRWLKSHDFKPIKRVHKTENYLRYRITDPKKYKRFITKEIANGIKLIIGYKK